MGRAGTITAFAVAVAVATGLIMLTVGWIAGDNADPADGGIAPPATSSPPVPPTPDAEPRGSPSVSATSGPSTSAGAGDPTAVALAFVAEFYTYGPPDDDPVGFVDRAEPYTTESFAGRWRKIANSTGGIQREWRRLNRAGVRHVTAPKGAETAVGTRNRQWVVVEFRAAEVAASEDGSIGQVPTRNPSRYASVRLVRNADNRWKVEASAIESGPQNLP